MKEKLEKLLRELDGLRALGDTLTEEQSKRFDEALAEAEKLDAQIKRAEKAEALGLRLMESAGRKVPDAPAGETRADIQVGEPDGGKPLFRNLGEFMQSLWRKDEKFLKYMNGAGGGAQRDYAPVKTSDTGVSALIPDQIYGSIVEVKGYDEILYPRAEKLPPGEQPNATAKILNGDQGTSGYFAGVTWTWNTEGGAIAPTGNPGATPVSLTPHKVTGTFNITSETLANAPMWNTWLMDKFSNSFKAMRDRALILGAGTTLPLGILNSACKLVVPRNTVSTIKYADVVALRQSIPASLLRRCIWLIASDARATMESLADGGNRLIWGNGDVSQDRPETLMGLPAFFYDHAALGALSDLSLVDPMSYFVKDGRQLEIKLSEHVRFLNDEIVVRFTAYFDGVCPIQDPVTEGNGHIVSPVAVLKAATS